MTIYIIDLSDPQYADLNAVQMSMVRVAQVKKNNLLAELEEEKKALFFRLLERGTVRAYARIREETRLTDAANAEVDAVREDLLQQLAYEALSSEGNENGPYRYPDNPNYNLSYSQRFLLVRNYYMEVESDAAARLEAYRMDSLARTYLGDFYQTLYDLLASYVK